MAETVKILALCIGNSCHSIMAETLINDLGKGRYEAKSAGSNPAGQVQKETLETLRRHGLETGQLHSKSWNEFSTQPFDVIIAICDAVSNKMWPLFPRNPKKLYWHIPDPAQTTGTEAEIAAAFDEIFLMIKVKVEEFLQVT